MTKEILEEKVVKRTFLNILYNAVYQIFLVLVPLITVPYLSRVLGPKTYGIYGSVNNTVQFLMVFCTLSVSYIEFELFLEPELMVRLRN